MTQPNKIFRLISLLCIYSLGALKAHAQQYNALTIPADLLPNASAVVRLEYIDFEVINLGKANYSVHTITTIFNENASDVFTSLQVDYDKFSKIKKIEGKVYNALGKEVYSLKNSDIKDIGLGVLSQNEITDNRAKMASIDKRNFTYPFTVEFYYEIEDHNLMFYPSWEPQTQDFVAVEKSTFKIKLPANQQFRYKEVNALPDLRKSVSPDGLATTWEIANLKATLPTAFSEKNNRMEVLTSPITFQLEDYTGNFSTWESVSAFYYELNKNRSQLPPTVVEEMKTLTADAPTTQEKIKRIYEYLQNHTRYYGIQLGVGGWQTIPAEKVVATGYGDCKALTNYMNALLKSIGINAYSVLIFAGDKNNTFNFDDFPTATFNHVISCVPMPNDTLWLECTSQTNPPNYLGSFTGNRKGLIIKPTGGKLINTHWYGPADNQQSRKATIQVDSVGNATAKITTYYTGILQDLPNAIATNYTTDQQRKWLQNTIEIGSFNLQHFELKPQKAKPELEETLDLSIRNCATVNGQRMFLKPNLMASFIEMPVEEDRKIPLYLNPNEYSFMQNDSLVFQLPASYQPEYLPPVAAIESVFGKYTSESKFENHELVYIRKLTLVGGKYPAEQYKEWLDFIKKIQKVDKTKVVFVKK